MLDKETYGEIHLKRTMDALNDIERLVDEVRAACEPWSSASTRTVNDAEEARSLLEGIVAEIPVPARDE